MPATFELSIPVILMHEGSSYVNEPNDPGGATRFGITIATLQRMKPGATWEDVRKLKQEDAIEIYRQVYWCPLFEQLDQEVATKLFDARVNAGGIGIELAQRCANILGHPCTVDGVFGPSSCAAIGSCDPRAFLREMGAQMAAHYERWIARDPEARAAFRKGLLSRALWPFPPTEVIAP